MSRIVLVVATPFDIAAYSAMPVVSDDERRRITEEWRDGVRYSLIAVKPAAVTDNLALGNHYHDHPEQFHGIGEGRLIVCNTNGTDTHRETHELPEEGGWEVLIPPGVAHTFVFSGTTPVTDGGGAVAVLLSQTNWPYRDENDPYPNTHSFPLT